MNRIAAILLSVLAMLPAARAADLPPVYVGIDAEFGLLNSTSAQAIEKGARVAVEEINRAGGVLGGRPLELVLADNKSAPARAKDDLLELAARRDLVAVLCGRFSPVVLETLDLIHTNDMVLLDPWASADGIVDNGRNPNFVFRLSLRDKYAMPAMIAQAKAKGAQRIALLVPNTGWGRSNAAAAERAATESGTSIVETQWYNLGDRTFAEKYANLRAAGAQALLMVANDLEGVAFVREVAALPVPQRLPIISHWGITGGRFFEEAAVSLAAVDLSVVQTFSFALAEPARLAAFLDTYRKLYGTAEPSAIAAPVGVAHAYDLVHILARAVTLAGNTDRKAVRAALEQVRDYDGLVRSFSRPFTPDRHDALVQGDVFMARYAPDGSLIPLSLPGKK